MSHLNFYEITKLLLATLCNYVAAVLNEIRKTSQSVISAHLSWKRTSGLAHFIHCY